MNQSEMFEISYTFDTDLQTAFEMWTDPNSFSNWLGPDGSVMRFLTTAVIEGGTSLWTMTTDDGQTKYGLISYKTISPNRLLVYTQNFSDQNGQFIKAPFSATYPDFLLTTVNFSKVENAVRLDLKWEIYGNASEIEKQTFSEMKDLMKVSWMAFFRKMELLLLEKNN